MCTWEKCRCDNERIIAMMIMGEILVRRWGKYRYGGVRNIGTMAGEI